MALPAFIFDTSPLITLAGAKVGKQTAIEYLVSVVQIIVVETVAQEATVNLIYPDAITVQSLLKDGKIQSSPVPQTPVDDLISAYPKLGVGKGRGERDTIRLGVTFPKARVIIDDQQAFFVAARFDLRPLMLLDLLVDLVRAGSLDKSIALQITTAIAGRYSAVSIQHTIYKLNGVEDDSNHN